MQHDYASLHSPGSEEGLAAARAQRQQFRTEAAIHDRTRHTVAGGLSAVRAAMKEEGHWPHPAIRDGYSHRYTIRCRFCPARVEAELTDDGIEATYDDATAVPCTAERS